MLYVKEGKTELEVVVVFFGAGEDWNHSERLFRLDLTLLSSLATITMDRHLMAKSPHGKKGRATSNRRCYPNSGSSTTKRIQADISIHVAASGWSVLCSK